MTWNDYEFATAFTNLWNRLQANFTWITSQLTAHQTAINGKASSTDLTTHTGNTTVHITSNERSTWNGKQNAITSSTKLDADLVDDSSSTHKFVSASDKSTWDGKQNAITSSNKLSADLLSEGTTNKLVSQTEKNTWNGKQDALSAEDLARIASVDDKADTTDLTTHTGNTTVHISASERSTWNAKQNALSAQDLARIASVDNKADASDLLNYFTKTEIQNLLTNKLRREIVSTLPAVADAEENVIYLIPNNSSEQNNAKDEYMLINGAFELIGTTHTDLSGYYTSTQIDTMLSDIATAGLNTITLLED